VVAPETWAPLDSALENIDTYEWLVFTSVNGVEYFFRRLFELGKDVRIFGRIRTAAIGPATAQRLFDYGLKSDIIPETYRAESVVAAFENESVKGKKILLPRAAEARPILPEELTRMGAEVDEIATYQTLQARENVDRLFAGLMEKNIDMITFTSSSTVKNFKSLFTGEDDFKRLMKGVTVACIGPITADTAAELGLDVHLVAESYTIPGLCQSIQQYFKDD